MPGINIPGIGEVDKKKALIIGGSTIAVIAIVMIRKKSAGTAAAATTTTTDPNAIDPATGIPYSQETGGSNSLIDPSTGIPYADEANGLGGYNVGGGGSVFDSGNYDAAGYPLGSQADLAWQAQVSGTSVAGQSITTKSEWVAAAEQQLGNTADVASALAKVLGGLPVTVDQQNLFLEAVGIIGQPPGGYPPIKLTNTAGQPNPTTPGTTMVSVPKVTGMSANQAIARLQASGFKSHLSTTRNPVHEYVVNSQTPGAGAKAAKGSTVDLGIRQK
jgi:hypothetical protein